MRVLDFCAGLNNHTGAFIKQGYVTADSNIDNPSLIIAAEKEAPVDGTADESYSLEVNSGKISLTAPTDLGLLYGLETLLQLGNFQPKCVLLSRRRN